MFVGTILGGFLGQWNLSVPYLARAVVLVLVFVVAARMMVEVGFTPKRLRLGEVPRQMREQARVGIAYGWDQRGLRLLMISGGIRGVFFGWAFYAAQPYFLELLGEDAVWIVGLVTAGVSLATIAGNQLVDVFSRRCGRRTTLLIIASAVSTVAAVVIGLTDTFAVAVAGLLVVAGAMGVMMPVRQSYLHHVTTSEHRATVVSFDAMVVSVGGVGGQIGLGTVADNRSFSAGYVVGGLFTGLAVPVLFALRRLGGPADQIVGSRGGVEGTCPSGLPRDTGVESRPVPAVVDR
jgi:MFS family permease